MVINLMSKSLAIIQSNYIPWKGYFDIINSADEFIILDDVQYTKNDWRNRNKIKTATGEIWLTIPIKTSNLSAQKINQTNTLNDLWIKKHVNSIIQNYSKAKYFNDYSDSIVNVYNSIDTTNLSEINIRFIKIICEILNIQTKITNSCDYTLVEGQTERLIELCKQTCSTKYVSGPAARNYIDENLFKKNDIKLIWFDYNNYPVYNQLYQSFEHKVSIIDLIFNEGPNAYKYMKSFGGNR